MNRAERRRLDKQNAKEQVITIKVSELEKIKQDAVNEALNLAFILMLSIPVMVLHDRIGQLWRKFVDGKSREERFAEYCSELHDSFQKGYVTLDDLINCLQKEAKWTVEKKRMWF